MTFPLPPGCRKVCRPVRIPPRVVKISAVVRFAKAAVDNGESPCAVVDAVSAAVGCERCADQIQVVRQTLERIETGVEDVLSAIWDVLDAFGIPRTPAPSDEAGVMRESWFRRVLRQLNLIAKVAQIVAALIRLVRVFTDFAADLAQLIRDVRALIDCVAGESP